jgi:hypothetical protein
MHSSIARAALAAPILLFASCCAWAQNQVSGNAFNPAISLILNGLYASYSRDPTDYGLPGFALDADAGLAQEGLGLDETELALSANVDDKFYGFMTTSLEQSDGETTVGLEEAYIETLALPKSLKLKAGRFLSDVGYLNPIHAHAWDFVDAPLAYTAMLNSAYADTGVQLRWVAPTILFVEIGAELMRGDSFPAANASASKGTGAATQFAHIGGDVGNNSWRAGISHLAADANERTSAITGGDLQFTGSSDVWIADFIWKWARNGNPRDRSFIVQGEYLSRSEDGELAFLPTAGTVADGTYTGDQSGFYLQGVYQFRPRWRAGLRYDRLSASNETTLGVPTPLMASGRPSRLSLMSDFSNSEFSRLRLQWSRDDSRGESDNQVFLQYLMSLGAHGAHRF